MMSRIRSTRRSGARIRVVSGDWRRSSAKGRGEMKSPDGGWGGCSVVVVGGGLSEEEEGEV